MNRIRTLIADDEPLARNTLHLLLSKDKDVDIVAECRDGREAVKEIGEKRPDLVFLDVQMPQMSGFDVIRTVGVRQMPLTVFVTAYDKYALRAFDAQALDYLLKPFEDSRFEKTLLRAKTLLAHIDQHAVAERFSSLLKNSSQNALAPEYISRLLINAKGKMLSLKTVDIDWIGADDYYAQIHVQRKTYLHRETLDQLEQGLDPSKFVRIHRSTIVNIDRVKELQPAFNGNYVVLLDTGVTLRLSRRRRDQLKQLL